MYTYLAVNPAQDPFELHFLSVSEATEEDCNCSSNLGKIYC